MYELTKTHQICAYFVDFKKAFDRVNYGMRFFIGKIDDGIACCSVGILACTRERHCDSFSIEKSQQQVSAAVARSKHDGKPQLCTPPECMSDVPWNINTQMCTIHSVANFNTWWFWSFNSISSIESVKMPTHIFLSFPFSFPSLQKSTPKGWVWKKARLKGRVWSIVF